MEKEAKGELQLHWEYFLPIRRDLKAYKDLRGYFPFNSRKCEILFSEN